MLKMEKFELEIIADPDIFIFFEKDTRGGISYTSNRYSKANKKYLKSFDPEQESKVYASLPKLPTLRETRIKTEKMIHIHINIQLITMVKTIYWIQHIQKTDPKKMETKMEINEHSTN